MKYWWVNQTENWRDEYARGYLYSGLSRSVYRRSILDLKENDILICTHGHGQQRQIYAIGLVAQDPSAEIIDRPYTRRPPARGKPLWLKGWEVQMEYTTLSSPVSWPPVWQQIRERYEGRHFTKKSPGVQGYLFPVPPDTAAKIVELVNREQPEETRFPIPETGTPADVLTAIKAEVMRRVGHQKWARDVKNMWGGQCAVTGFDVKRLLRASHIVPWAEDERSRLDNCNGICLSPSYDAAFDANLITFLDDGRIAFAPAFDANMARKIGIDAGARLTTELKPNHLKYLELHRRKTLARKTIDAEVAE